MRVNPTNSSAIQNGTETSATKKSEKAKSKTYDARPKEAGSVSNSESAKTEISSKAQQMAKAKQIASDAPDVRDAKIAELREKIQSKKYDVSAEAIADRLVDDHLRMPGA